MNYADCEENPPDPRTRREYQWPLEARSWKFNDITCERGPGVSESGRASGGVLTADTRSERRQVQWKVVGGRRHCELQQRVNHTSICEEMKWVKYSETGMLLYGLLIIYRTLRPKILSSVLSEVCEARGWTTEQGQKMTRRLQRDRKQPQRDTKLQQRDARQLQRHKMTSKTQNYHKETTSNCK